jgi:PTH1 family peptidyl-tRNA hydrolase
MKLIVGLGNPGIEYQFTPHNLGFLTVDRLAERHKVNVNNRHCRALTGRTKIGSEDVLLAKPETFMNLSGIAVRELVEKYEVNVSSDLIVIYDELDLPFGQVRIRPRGGTAGHNGMESIIGALGTQEFIRVRLGIAPDHPVRDGARYVLAQFKKLQYDAVDLLLDTAADAVTAIVTDGAQAAMNRFNRKAQSEEKGSAEAGS